MTSLPLTSDNLKNSPQEMTNPLLPERRISFGRSLQSMKNPDSSSQMGSPSPTLPLFPAFPRPMSQPIPNPSRTTTHIYPKGVQKIPTGQQLVTKLTTNQNAVGSAYKPTADQSSIVSTSTSETEVRTKCIKNENEVVISEHSQKLEVTETRHPDTSADTLVGSVKTVVVNENITTTTGGSQRDKEAPAYRTEISTQPSSLTSATTDLSEAKNIKRKVTTRIESLKKLLGTLEKVIEFEFSDLEAYDSSAQQSNLILHDVTHNLYTARELISTRNEQLEDANKRIRLLMGENLTECSPENLEDISDILWSGLQAATLALSRRQNKSITIEEQELFTKQQLREKSAVQFVASSIPEAKFVPIAAPQIKASGIKAEELCTQLINILEEVKSIQHSKSYEFTNLKNHLHDLQAKIEATNKQYDKERSALLLLEKKLDTRLRQANRLTGRDSYESLSVAQLADLCKTINKASRKLTTEQAIREVRAQQGVKEDEINDTKCFVCFERHSDCRLEPCLHTLCTECAARLRYCPHCRQQILQKKKIDEDISQFSTESSP